MVRLSLDSSTAVELIRGERIHFRQILEQARARGDQIHVSAVVLQELAFGALRSPRPEHHLRRLDLFISDFGVEAWTADDGMVTARLRADLEGAGSRIGAYDTLIAGQALCRGWSVVTSNVREFIRVKGLHVVDWSDPTGPIEFGKPSSA